MGAAQAAEAGKIDVASNLQMSSKRHVKIARRKKKKEKKKRKKAKKDDGSGGGLPYDHLIMGFDLCPSSALPGNKLVRDLKRVATTGPFRDRVHVFKANSNRTSKQADPAGAIISGQRAD